LSGSPGTDIGTVTGAEEGLRAEVMELTARVNRLLLLGLVGGGVGWVRGCAEEASLTVVT